MYIPQAILEGQQSSHGQKLVKSTFTFQYRVSEYIPAEAILVVCVEISIIIIIIIIKRKMYIIVVILFIYSIFC